MCVSLSYGSGGDVQLHFVVLNANDIPAVLPWATGTVVALDEPYD